MNKAEKELIKIQAANEKKVIRDLKSAYVDAIKKIEDQIKILQADEITQSKIYQIQYQQALKTQIEAALVKIQSNNYQAISDYVNNEYVNGWVGTFYNLREQGIPIIAPIDQEAVIKAVQLDSKLSKPLYESLGINVQELKKAVRNEISRGIASGERYQDIARNISNSMWVDMNKAIRIAVTEGHRVQNQSKMEALHRAQDIGADIVKQWDSTLDKKTRPSHQKVDGEIRELDEVFSNGLMYPGDKNGPAKEVIRCRCVMLERARWGLNEEELEALKERAKFYGLDKSKNFEEFKSEYLKMQIESSADQYYKPLVRENEEKFSESRNGKIVASKLKGYKDVYVETTTRVKPKEVHNINKSINEAIKNYRGDILNMPKIVITHLDKIKAYGKYDCLNNVIFIIPECGNKAKIDKISYLEFKDTEYHEVWHWIQREKYRKEISDELDKKTYLSWLRNKCKKRIEKLGINAYNVSNISNYAKDMYEIGFYDEVEAEYIVKSRKGRE